MWKDKRNRLKYQRQWRKNNPEKKSAYHKKWRDKNKEKEKLRTRKWQKENPTKVIAQQRNWAYSTGRNWREAGMKNEKGEVFGFKDYENLFERQQGKCAICEKPNSEMKQRFNTDHNHQTGKVRGLLCTKCNFQLGIIEKKEFVQKALKYLGVVDFCLAVK